MKYNGVLRHSDETYSVSMPGLPGCWSQGTTELEAIENIKDAIHEYLADVNDLFPDVLHDNLRFWQGVALIAGERKRRGKS